MTEQRTELDRLADVIYHADMQSLNEPESLLPLWEGLDEVTQKRYRAMAKALRTELKREVISSVKVGTGIYRSAWYLNEVPPDSQQQRLVLQQDVTLPTDAILGIIALASAFREMRDHRESKRLSICPSREIALNFIPQKEIGQKGKEIVLELGGRTLYMGVATLLRLADALSLYQKMGTLENPEQKKDE